MTDEYKSAPPFVMMVYRSGDSVYRIVCTQTHGVRMYYLEWQCEDKMGNKHWEEAFEQQIDLLAEQILEFIYRSKIYPNRYPLVENDMTPADFL